MPKISLWSPTRTNDYKFIDRIAGEATDLGATGVYLHKYIGPKLDADDGRSVNEMTIQDVLFMENRERSYDDSVYEMRGHYDPADRDFDLTQFGLMFSDDTVQLVFHISNMVDRLGRKIISGDVIELPHLREMYALDDDAGATNRYYVVEEGSNYGQGYGPTWDGHFWRIRAKLMTDSSEFRDIIGDGSNEDDLRNDLSTYCKYMDITDEVVLEAAANVPYDPKYFETDHLYVQDNKDGTPFLYWKDGDVNGPNGQEIAGTGGAFPVGLTDGEYFLRTDFMPNRLFLKKGNCFVKIEDDRQQPWTATNKLLDTFLDNDNITNNTDGTTAPEKTALSKVVKPKDN